MCAEDFSVSRRTSSGVDFRVCSDSVFVNDFWFCRSLCVKKISPSAVELGSGDDFRFCGDSVFVSDFWFCRSLWLLKISASAGELGSGDDFRVCSDLVFVNDSDSAAVYAPRRFHFQVLNWFRWWFLGLQQRSFRQWFWFCSSLCGLKISTSAGELGFGDDFSVCSDVVFVNDFWLCSSLCALKISATPAELVSGDDLWVCSDSVFVNDFWSCISLYAVKISA